MGRAAVVMCAALLLVLSCGGCSTFRAMFDEDPAVTKQKRERAKKAKEAELNSTERPEVIPSFFGKPKKLERSSMLNSELTPQERALLEESEKSSFPSSSELDEVRRRNKKQTESSSDFVFGSGLKDWL